MIAVAIYWFGQHVAGVVFQFVVPVLNEPVNAPPRGCTHFKLRQLLRVVGRLYDAELAQVGMKGTQYSLLSHVVALAPVQPAELARQMGMDASTLTRNLRVLMDEGWIVQGPGKDARSRLVQVTAEGRSRHRQAQRHWKRAQESLNERLGSESVAMLHVLIDQGLGLLNDPADSVEDAS